MEPSRRALCPSIPSVVVRKGTAKQCKCQLLCQRQNYLWKPCKCKAIMILPCSCRFCLCWGLQGTVKQCRSRLPQCRQNCMQNPCSVKPSWPSLASIGSACDGFARALHNNTDADSGSVIRIICESHAGVERLQSCLVSIGSACAEIHRAL